MRDKAEVVIVGAGIMGLAIAYNLAKHHGITDVVVVEKSYLCGGASGRNGGGVRAQFSSEENIRLMQESIRICRDFAHEMRINVWFRQGGYLFLVRSEEGRRTLEKSVAVQNGCGLGTRMLTPKEAQRIVPELDFEGVVAASYNPEDGVVFPWPFVWGYAQGAERLGVDIATFTTVTGFRTTGQAHRRGGHRQGRDPDAPRRERRRRLEPGGRPPARRRAAQPPAPPRDSARPSRSSCGSSRWWRTSPTGSTSRSRCAARSSAASATSACRRGSTWARRRRSSRSYSRALLRACPILGSVKVLRQWAGCYDLTPDANPIVGEVDEVEGFYQASGFMGHGFMMAPVMGRILARHLAEGSDVPMFDRWNLRRFKEGRLLSEAMIIG